MLSSLERYSPISTDPCRPRRYGSNNGSSWADAYVYLHDALDNYAVDDEIWVADGTYLPGGSNAWTSNARTTIYIHQNVKLYGGFNGTETELNQRNPIANPTVLSGDISGDDAPADLLANRNDNIFNVGICRTGHNNGNYN